jgi:hypothetical protein
MKALCVMAGTPREVGQRQAALYQANSTGFSIQDVAYMSPPWQMKATRALKWGKGISLGSNTKPTGTIMRPKKEVG